MTLKTILKGHYKEDDTSDLYQKLINICQEPKESAQDFLFRAIELKNRLLFAAKGGDTEEPYSADLVKKKFLRSVGTGLLSDNVKFQIKPFLNNQDVTDEILIEKVTETATLDAERHSKLKRNNTRLPKVNELQTSNPGDGLQRSSTCHRQPERIPKEPAKDKSKPANLPPESEVHTPMKDLQTKVAEMKWMMLASMSTERPPHSILTTGARDTQKRGCNGEGSSCSHCFKCGQQGHISRGCRAPHQVQENSRGLLPKDQQ